LKNPRPEIKDKTKIKNMKKRVEKEGKIKNKRSKYVRKMGLKSEKQDKIMEIFYENPNRKFTVREIEKMINLPKTTISEYLREMKSKKLLNENSLFFKIKKTNHIIEKMALSGLLDFLIKELNPSGIILFGSMRKREYNKESGIDLFIETSEKKEVELKVYEKILWHKIQLFIEQDINKLPANLFNNIINGIKLYGSFKLK